jgi:uncharacterized membrane protein required for colicin V production
MQFVGAYVSWFDLLAAAVLLLGLTRGRRRGMSEELLDVMKWLAILLVGGFFYEPLGNVLAERSVFSLLSSYLAVYLAIMAGVHIVFSFVRRKVGAKLVESDFFGSAEYYLGMAGGVLRYGCILMVCMALLNARLITAQEIVARNQAQEQSLGTVFFPGLHSFQEEVFKRSLTGRLTQSYLSAVLIRPTAPQAKSLADSGVVRARERQLYDVFDKK